MRRWVDFLILAPLPLEIDALREKLNFPVLPTGTWNRANTWSIDLAADDGRPLHVEVVQLNTQGVLNTGVFTTRLILEWQPWCVISFGIAGGFIGDDITIGDVIVPQQVIYYEPAKETVTDKIKGEKGTKKRAAIDADSSKRQSRMFPYFADKLITDKCIEVGRKSGNTGKGKLCYGPLASGEKLISDVDALTRKAITDINDKILAVEMEAAGVAAAVAECAQIVESKLLVIKGISDNAGKYKNHKGNRRCAADNAATLLSQTIRALSPDYTHLKRLQYNNSALMKRVEAFLNAFPENFHYLKDPKRVSSIDPIDVKRILKNPERTPVVYYKWRIKEFHSFVHWVDFYYLLVLRRLQDLGISVCLLVADPPEALQSTKNQIQGLVDVLFQRGADLIWYSDVKDNLDFIVSYAADNGFYTAVSDAVGKFKYTAISNAVGKLEPEVERAARDEVLNWLCYIAWSAQPSERCIILPWGIHEDIYKQLMHALSLDCLIIPRGTITLDGVDAKSSLPGKALVIDPPCYRSILNWLKDLPHSGQVEEINNYLCLGETVVEDKNRVEEFLESYGLSLIHLEGRDDIIRLLNTMVNWNLRYFSGTDNADSW